MQIKLSAFVVTKKMSELCCRNKSSLRLELYQALGTCTVGWGHKRVKADCLLVEPKGSQTVFNHAVAHNLYGMPLTLAEIYHLH